MTKSYLEAICLDITELVQKHCDGQMRHECLTKDHPILSLECGKG